MLRFIYCQPIFNLILLIIASILITAHINIFLKKYLWRNVFNLILLISSVAILIYTTVLGRGNNNYHIELRPFYTFVLAQQYVEYYRTFFMNALLFVPIGLSMPYALSKKPHKRNVFITIGFAVVLSAGIEFLQYYYHLGVCETDDVIANTLGAAIGTLSYCLYINILKNREKESLMQNTINNNQKLLLDLSAKSLFGKDCDLPQDIDCDVLIDESLRQTVFPQIYSYLKDIANTDSDKLFSKIIAKNIRVEYGHNEVHNVLTKKEIPYFAIKGVASSSYYKEPSLRMMGDIDIVVPVNNFTDADKALKSIGFTTNEQLDGGNNHIAYKRKDGLVCELHRNINGIPLTATGELIEEYFYDVFEKSTVYKTSNGSCIIPDKFHHGLVLLLHTATHLTHEGVGLRHLCDWAVFVNSMSNDEFVNIFEKALMKVGLWRFAQLLTLCCVKYLGCDKKAWAGESDDKLLEGIIADILNGGNFGHKDAERYSQIKYISDRKNSGNTKKSPVLQLFSSINQKTKKDFKFVNKSKILLPIGWLFTVCKYLYMVVIGKRRLDSISTISGARIRKEIYNEFKLFENDQA